MILKQCVLNGHFNKKFAMYPTRNMHAEHLKTIFSSAVSSVQPSNLVRDSITVSERHLVANGHKHQLLKPCYVVGFGKAVLGMATELEKLLKDRLAGGIVSVPEGTFHQLADQPHLLPASRLRFIEGAHNNLPDERAMKTAGNIKEFVEKLDEDDVLIVLISGGGSALLPLPKAPVTLDEKLKLVKALGNKGATINELNSVRKALSVLKGGGLGKLAYPAKVVSLILSDVIGDPLDVIASGPTVPNSDLPGTALSVVKKHDLYKKLPKSIKTVLENDSENADGADFGHVTNHVIGNNCIAAEAAIKRAQTCGYVSLLLSTTLSGDVRTISQLYARLAYELSILTTNPSARKKDLRALLNEFALPNAKVEEFVNADLYGKGVCVVGAGEPTVVVTGSGKGGRNQQLALSFAFYGMDLLEQARTANVSFLSCGTDGFDGPTDAAGAFVRMDGWLDTIRNEQLDPYEFLNNNDAYNFFRLCDQERAGLVQIGHTGTNVMDIHLLIVTPNTVIS